MHPVHVTSSGQKYSLIIISWMRDAVTGPWKPRGCIRLCLPRGFILTPTLPRLYTQDERKSFATTKPQLIKYCAKCNGDRWKSVASEANCSPPRIILLPRSHVPFLLTNVFWRVCRGDYRGKENRQGRASCRRNLTKISSGESANICAALIPRGPCVHPSYKLESTC